jgi:hypothetical protein
MDKMSFCSDPVKLRMFKLILDPAWNGVKLPSKLSKADLLRALLDHWHSDDNNIFKTATLAAMSDTPDAPPATPGIDADLLDEEWNGDETFKFGRTPASTLEAGNPSVSVTNPDGSMNNPGNLDRRPFCKLLWKGRYDKNCKCNRVHTDICKLQGCKPTWDPECLFFHASGKGRGGGPPPQRRGQHQQHQQHQQQQQRQQHWRQNGRASQRGNPELGLRTIQYKRVGAELRAAKLQLELDREKRKRRPAFLPPLSSTQATTQPLAGPMASTTTSSTPDSLDIASVLAKLVHQVNQIQYQLGSRY